MKEKKDYIILKKARAKSWSFDNITNFLFDSYIELHGDRLQSDDLSIRCGIASIKNKKMGFICSDKGVNIEERNIRHFGCPEPSGYRKAKRLGKLFEKFNLPVISLVNTSGAYPGLTAEENGQFLAISDTLINLGNIHVPFISVIYGEGGSGGALALACGDSVWMSEYSVYSVLSPEGFATILWHNIDLTEQAVSKMLITPKQLMKLGVVDKIIEEGDCQVDIFCKKLRELLIPEFDRLSLLSKTDLLKYRRSRYRKF